jgi:KDO2-lipid IV(A) lauroyltransferase
MFSVCKICATLFSRIAYGVLRVAGWKRSTVYANLRYVGDAVLCVKGERCPLLQNPKAFYCGLLHSLVRHVGELLFCFGFFKRLPAAFSAYPCRVGGWNFDIAEGSAEVLDKMRGGGIFLTAHYGNYEAIGPWLCCLGIPLKASYIPVKPAWLNRILEGRIRAVDGYRYSIDARTPREFLRLLDEGRLFCLLADQDSRIPSATDGIFLGKPVHNNPLPEFLLKHRPETPVFVCWMEERGKATKVLHAVEIQRESVMESFNDWLGGRIAENPTLWYGFTHRRFMSKESRPYLLDAQ